MRMLIAAWNFRPPKAKVSAALTLLNFDRLRHPTLNWKKNVEISLACIPKFDEF